MPLPLNREAWVTYVEGRESPGRRLPGIGIWSSGCWPTFIRRSRATRPANWHVAITSAWRSGGAVATWRGLRIRASPEKSGKQYRLFADSLAAIGTEEPAALGKALEKHLLDFPGERKHAEDLPLAASFLWHVAERQGLYAGLPSYCQKWLVILPEDPSGNHPDRQAQMERAAPPADTPAAAGNTSFGISVDHRSFSELPTETRGAARAECRPSAG